MRLLAAVGYLAGLVVLAATFMFVLPFLLLALAGGS